MRPRIPDQAIDTGPLAQGYPPACQRVPPRPARPVPACVRVSKAPPLRRWVPARARPWDPRTLYPPFLVGRARAGRYRRALAPPVSAPSRARSLPRIWSTWGDTVTVTHPPCPELPPVFPSPRPFRAFGRCAVVVGQRTRSGAHAPAVTTPAPPSVRPSVRARHAAPCGGQCCRCTHGGRTDGWLGSGTEQAPCTRTHDHRVRGLRRHEPG